MLPYPLPKSGILCSAGARKMGISTPKIEWSHLAAGFGSLLDNCFKTVKVGDVRASLDRDSAILNNGDPVMLSTPELSISGQKLTPEQFLALPEGDIVYELVDGRAVSKNEPMSPKRFHARLQPVLWRILEDWCSSPECPKPGSAHTEWAVVLTRKAEPWIPVPDVTYISNERLPVEAMTDEPCFAIPELVIEILSAGQSFGAIAQKATDYLEAGIPRVWVVDPQAKSITVFYPDAPPRTFTGSQVIQDDFLPGLKVIPQDVFAQARIP